MAEQQLITRTELIDTYDVGKNYREDRANSHIMRAQRNDLRTWIGAPMYFDLCENYDSDIYQTLLNGGEYVYQGNTIYFQGIKALVAAYAYSRILRDNDTFVTNSGDKIKTDPNSQRQEQVRVMSTATEARSEAINIAKDVVQFIQANSSDYPLFNQNQETPQQTSFYFKKL